ncbi:MAG: hypothetical protein ABIJ48_10035 [Actinomycetota bacterium]
MGPPPRVVVLETADEPGPDPFTDPVAVTPRLDSALLPLPPGIPPLSLRLIAADGSAACFTLGEARLLALARGRQSDRRDGVPASG